MNENIIKQPPLPNAIQFHTRQNDDMTEVMRITREGVWVNPDMQVDETAKAVLDALDSQVKVLVQRAVEQEREKVAKWMMEQGYATGHGDTIQDLLKELEWQVAEREREWVGLTDEEIEDAMDYWSDDEHSDFGGAYQADGEYFNVRASWRYIEAKLKEKNSG